MSRELPYKRVRIKQQFRAHTGLAWSRHINCKSTICVSAAGPSFSSLLITALHTNYLQLNTLTGAPHQSRCVSRPPLAIATAISLFSFTVSFLPSSQLTFRGGRILVPTHLLTHWLVPMCLAAMMLSSVAETPGPLGLICPHQPPATCNNFVEWRMFQ